MGRAYWPWPARAGQAYVLAAAIGQVAREVRGPCVPTVGTGQRGSDLRPGNKARVGAGGKDTERWHSRTLAKGRESTDVSQQHLPVQYQ